MCSKEVLINNQIGLRARPATFFIQKANEFKCSIQVEREELYADEGAEGAPEYVPLEAYGSEIV